MGLFGRKTIPEDDWHSTESRLSRLEGQLVDVEKRINAICEHLKIWVNTYEAKVTERDPGEIKGVEL